MVPGHITGKWNNQIITKTMYFGYYTSKLRDKETGLLYTILISSHDDLCLRLMTWASRTMVSILYRHKQRVQHIHETKVSSRPSPEIRATQSIVAW